MINRNIENAIRGQIGKYPVITITGPRQSGKTTLIKQIFPSFTYFSLEDPNTRAMLDEDPRKVFDKYGHRLIFDEVQRLPVLLSYIQGIVDDDRDACFILSGSHNMLMMESVTQTLAGRVAIFYLLPLSHQELKPHIEADVSADQLIFSGGYPRIYDRGIDPVRFYADYLETYVQRDVRQVKNIGNLNVFMDFIKICAGFTGQLINYRNIANAVGISEATAKTWMSILETSYVVFQLGPYYRNFKKRIVKSRKLYFYDTGLACSLLGLSSAEAVGGYYQRGALFENFVLNEMTKASYNAGQRPDFYFWRDSNQREIDLLINRGTYLQPIEIKSGTTFRKDYFKQVDWFTNLANVPVAEGRVIYGGDQQWEYENGSLISWREVGSIVA